MAVPPLGSRFLKLSHERFGSLPDVSDSFRLRQRLRDLKVIWQYCLLPIVVLVTLSLCSRSGG
jgi:hypothetical protein